MAMAMKMTMTLTRTLAMTMSMSMTMTKRRMARSARAVKRLSWDGAQCASNMLLNVDITGTGVRDCV